MSGANEFDLLGGHPALDLVNTLDWRLAPEPVERLTGVESLVAWASTAELVDAVERRTLLATAARSPGRAAELVERVRALRELAYRLLEPFLSGARPRPADLEQLNAWMEESGLRAVLAWTGEGYAWSRARRGDAGERLVGRLLEALTELLTSPESGRVAQCQDDRGCGYVFLDRSPARARRWCSMADCGNRAKARRHHQRCTGR